MSIRSSVLLLAVLPVVAQVQNTLPPDIHPVTLSRLPPVTAEDLDEEGRRLLAARTDFTPGPGPTHITIYSPRDRDLGIPSGESSPVGPRYFQLAVLITAREIDQQYEWSSHEPAGLKAGLDQSVIDAVKYNRGLTGVPEKDAAVIQLGRAIFRDHRVSRELWATMERVFGRQGAVEVTMIMADYAMAGFILTAVDQQLPPDRKPLLPPR